MPRNGTNGNYSLPQAAFVPGTTISSAAVNSDLSDITTALTASICVDGQTAVTGPIKFTAGNAGAPGITFATDTGSGIYLSATGKPAIGGGGLGLLVLDSTQVGAGQSGGILQYANGAFVRNVGEVFDFAGSSAPSGSFLCTGQAVSRSSYPELFNVIGTAFGAGDGITTFNVPDCRGRSTYGLDSGNATGRLTNSAGSGISAAALGNTGGEQAHTLVTAELSVHSHANSLTDNGHLHPVAQASGIATGGGGTVTSTGTGAGVTGTATTGITITNANAGSGSAHNNTPPGIVLNKCIFAGRL